MEMSEMELRLIDPGKHRTLKILHMITTFMHFQHDHQIFKDYFVSLHRPLCQPKVHKQSPLGEKPGAGIREACAVCWML